MQTFFLDPTMQKMNAYRKQECLVWLLKHSFICLNEWNFQFVDVEEFSQE